VEGYNLLLVELIELYMHTDRLDEAEPLIAQFDEQYVGKDEFKHASRVEKCKGDYFTALGKTKKAQIHFERSVALKDSLYRIRSDEEIHELEASFRSGLQEEEVQLLSVENSVKENRIKQVRVYLIILLISLSLSAASLIWNRQKAKQNARLSQKFLEEKKRAENNALFKEQSMNILSHEVRTPINGIINLTEFLKCQCPNDELHEMVEMIETSAVRLNNVVMNVLNVAKYQAGLLEMDLLPTDVVEVCQQAVASFAHSAKLEMLHLDYEGSEQPVHCLLDAQLLHSILNNLIGNSLKFTPSGGHIVVSVEQKSDRGIIRVRDTGSGMTQDQVKAIFKPFQQVSEEKQKRRVGTGLGLSIVSQFTELMSGTVDVESQKGEGTTFTLSFPLQA
jgi:signal transduction histidine kinase